ncbi:MAG TPA: hypothetical protein VMR25_10670 [Planctomycetaceae bacterium]|jgi:hypothetical protein|nr:hypothetical protein [Planctomycetaceae bacterium]
MAKVNGKTSTSPAIQAKRPPDVKEIAGLHGGGDRDAVTVAAQPGRHPYDVKFCSVVGARSSIRRSAITTTGT